MRLRVTNSKEIDKWISARLDIGRVCYSIKGPPPEGARYSDGTLIKRPINVGWRDGATGEVIKVEYEHSSDGISKGKP